MLLVTFAVPHESRVFRRNSAAKGISILHTGIGEDAAGRAVRTALERQRPSAVIASGFAGGLDPSLQVGDLIVDSAVSSPDLLRELPPSIHRGRIHTASLPVDSPAMKSQLHRECGALAVDMETRAIAAECARFEVPLLVLRAISDAARDPIPVPLDIVWDLQRQTPRPFRLAMHLALHPRRLGPFIAFLRNTNKAAERLGQALAGLPLAKSPWHCK